MGEVAAIASVEPHPVAVLARDDLETIVLDFVQLQSAGGRFFGLGGQTGRDEARERTQHGRFIGPPGQSRQAKHSHR